MSLLHRAPKIEEAPLQEELLLFDPSSSRFFLLNRTMAFVWKNGEGKGVDSLAAEMVGAFEGADESLVREDLKKAVAELESMGLVRLDTA